MSALPAKPRTKEYFRQETNVRVIIGIRDISTQAPSAFMPLTGIHQIPRTKEKSEEQVFDVWAATRIVRQPVVVV
jgi:hypothetical protein